MNKTLSFTLCVLASLSLFLGHTNAANYLKENLQKTVPGDFIVLSFNKTNTLLNIHDKADPVLTIEEIVVPECLRKDSLKWRQWAEQGAPGHTSWVLYDIDTSTGQMLRYYSFTKKGWFEIPDVDNFLSKLLNLRLHKLPESQRKKTGRASLEPGPERQELWHPPMIVDGQIVKGVKFDAWRTSWPKDGSELSGRSLDLYLPQNEQGLPSYFPYWLQVNGPAIRTKIRVIDSGKRLHSIKPSLNDL